MTNLVNSRLEIWRSCRYKLSMIELARADQIAIFRTAWQIAEHCGLQYLLDLEHGRWACACMGPEFPGETLCRCQVFAVLTAYKEEIVRDMMRWQIITLLRNRHE